MCVGIPMRIERSEGAFAWCVGRTGRRRINMLWLGPQPEGAWILATQDSARQRLTEEEACRIEDALDAVEAVLRGETPDLDALFADLVGREPPLPGFLDKG
jgi:hydrogenase assembly chaperone HypC/HupF